MADEIREISKINYNGDEYIIRDDTGRFSAVGHGHGNITGVGAITTTTVISNGDRLIIADSSASSSGQLIASSITFSSSNTSSFLRADGTWAAVSTVDSYQKTGSWSGLTYTAASVGNAETLSFTIPTGTTDATVALGNHSHGDINNNGTVSSTTVTPASGDYILITDHSATNTDAVKRGIAIGTSTTSFLANDGTWKTPVDKDTITSWYGTSATVSNTSAKTVTCANFTLQAGSTIGVLFTTSNTAATPTLNVNSTGAKNIYVGNATANTTTNVLRWSANTMVYFMYDGTQYRYITSMAAGDVDQPRGANTWYGTSSTAATTTAKASTINNFVLTKGAIVTVSFSTANTVTNAAITLNINSTGAKSIYLNNGATSATNNLTWAANTIMTFMYNGTGYVLLSKNKIAINDLPTGTTSTTVALGNHTHDYASSGHTHTTTISQTGTSQIDLAANTIYTLTAGGTTVVFKTPADSNTTYTAATSVTSISTTSSTGTSTAYARADHVHNIALATGDNNGEIKVAGSTVSVKGLGTAAYTSSTAYASSTHNHDSVYAAKTHTHDYAASTHTHSKADITDFPTSMTPSSHTHGNIQNGGTLQTNDVTIDTGDKLVITDSSDSNKVARASISFDTSSTTSFLRNDGKWATPVGTTYTVTVTGTGNAITNIGLSGTTITATKGSSFAASTHTHSKADISDFPTSMTPASHTHGNIQNGGTLQTTDVTIATGDKLVITDSSDSHKVARASITFNTSSTTSFLRNDGKWATPVDNDTITTWYGTSSTAATTTAKTSAITNFALVTGAIATISFSTANTVTNAAITLNINSTGAKTIYLDNGVTSSTNQLTWAANTVMTFMYNGTGYVLISTSKPVVAQIVRW